MDRKQRADMIEPVTVTVYSLQIDNRKRGLPVVTMEKIGIIIEITHHLENGSREESETFAVVEKAVKPLSLEIILVVDEIESDPFVFITEKPAVLISPRDGNVEISFELKIRAERRIDIPIQRDRDADIVISVCRKRLGKRAYNVGKTARPRKRICLGRNEQHGLMKRDPDLRRGDFFFRPARNGFFFDSRLFRRLFLRFFRF